MIVTPARVERELNQASRLIIAQASIADLAPQAITIDPIKAKQWLLSRGWQVERDEGKCGWQLCKGEMYGQNVPRVLLPRAIDADGQGVADLILAIAVVSLAEEMALGGVIAAFLSG